MKKKIGIMVDGSCTLTEKELKKFDAKRLDFRILNTNTNEEYKDTLEGLDQIVKKSLEKNEVFKTSCTPIGEIIVAMEEMLEDFDQIIVLPMHKCISSQYNNIKSEASEYPGKVFVIDATMMNNEIDYYEKNMQPRMLYPARLSLKIEGEIKSLQDKQKLKELQTQNQPYKKYWKGSSKEKESLKAA